MRTQTEAAVALGNAQRTSREALERSRGFGTAKALLTYQDDATNAAKAAESAVTGSLQRMEDALVEFGKTGRINFSSLFQFMADEFLRQQARMLLASATTGGGGVLGGFLSGGFGGLVSAIGGVFGGSGAVPIADGSGATGDFARFDRKLTKLATGTNFIPDDGAYYLHKGEAVQPTAYNPAVGGRGGGLVYQDNSTHYIDSRTDQAQIAQISGDVSRRQIEAFAEHLRANGALA